MKNINNSDMELEEIDFQNNPLPGELDYGETLDKINSEFNRINERLLTTCTALDELEISQAEMRDNIKAQIKSVTESIEDIRNKSNKNRLSIFKEFESRIKSIERNQRLSSMKQNIMIICLGIFIIVSLCFR